MTNEQNVKLTKYWKHFSWKMQFFDISFIWHFVFLTLRFFVILEFVISKLRTVFENSIWHFEIWHFGYLSFATFDIFPLEIFFDVVSLNHHFQIPDAASYIKHSQPVSWLSIRKSSKASQSFVHLGIFLSLETIFFGIVHPPTVSVSKTNWSYKKKVSHSRSPLIAISPKEKVARGWYAEWSY